MLDYRIKTEIPLTDRKGIGFVWTTFYSNDGRYFKRIQKYKVWFNAEEDRFDYEWLTDDWFLCDATVLTEDDTFSRLYMNTDPHVKEPTDKTKWAEWLEDVRKKGVVEWESIGLHDMGFENEMNSEMHFLVDEDGQ